MSNKVNKSNFEVNYLNNVIGTGDGKLSGFMVAKELPEMRPSIALDSYNRIYFNADCRNVIGIRSGMEVIVAYNPEKLTFAIIKSKGTALHSEFSAVVDKRYYVNVKSVVEHFQLSPKNKGTVHYDYIGTDAAGKANLFRLRK